MKKTPDAALEAVWNGQRPFGSHLVPQTSTGTFPRRRRPGDPPAVGGTSSATLYPQPSRKRSCSRWRVCQGKRRGRPDRVAAQ